MQFLLTIVVYNLLTPSLRLRQGYLHDTIKLRVLSRAIFTAERKGPGKYANACVNKDGEEKACFIHYSRDFDKKEKAKSQKVCMDKTVADEK